MADALFAHRAATVRDLLLEELRARRSTGGSTENVLGAMLASDPPIDDEAIINQLLNELMASQEPPAIALANVVYELAGRPTVAKRFLATPDTRRTIIAEVLRLRPSASAVLRQLTDADGGRGSPPARRDCDRVPESAAASRSDRVSRSRCLRVRPVRRRAAGRRAIFSVRGGMRRCIGEALAEAQFRAVLPVMLEQWRFAGRGRVRSGWSSGRPFLSPIAAASRARPDSDGRQRRRRRHLPPAVRIAPRTASEIGRVNHLSVRVAGLGLGTAAPNIFTTLARNRSLFRRWLRFAGGLMPGGRLPRPDTEL
jgi:cytochrome P450